MWCGKYNDGSIPMWTGLGLQEKGWEDKEISGESKPEYVLMGKNQSYKNNRLLLLRLWWSRLLRLILLLKSMKNNMW